VKVALTGLAQSGKTTFFNAVTGIHAVAATGGRGGFHLGQVKVPDDRMDFLNKLINPKKLTHATIDLVDLPGIERGGGRESSKSNNAVIVQMRESDAIAIVVRAFESDSVAHPLKTIDPARDLMEVLSDFALADLGIIERRIAKLKKAPSGMKPEDKRELVLLENSSIPVYLPEARRGHHKLLRKRNRLVRIA